MFCDTILKTVYGDLVDITILVSCDSSMFPKTYIVLITSENDPVSKSLY